MKDYENAERIINNSINIISDVEENSPILSNWTYHLGIVYKQQNKHDKALVCFKTSLEHKLKNYGENSPEVAEAYKHLADAYTTLGERELANEDFRKSLDILQ